MEELCKSRKFHFPGYDGALPKAMRTSRGRSAYQRKVNQDPTDLNCIELLATVAGQVLQAKSSREENVDTRRAYTLERMNSGGGVSSCQMNFTPMVEDVGNFENRQDLNMAQMKDLEKVAASNFFQGSGLPTSIVCPQNAKNALFADPSEVKAGFSNTVVVSTSDVNIVLKKEGSMPTSAPEVPEPGHLGSHVHSESLKASDADCGSLKDANINEGGSCTMLPDDSPLSPGSSEEALTHVYKHTHSLCSEQPLETHLDFSQDLARLNAKDDDDNFSDLVVPATTPPVRHLVPSIERTQQLMQAQQENNFYQEEELATVVDRTKGIVTDGNNDVESHLHCLRKFPSQQPQVRKMHCSSKSCKVSIDSYKTHSFNPLESDAKDTSVGSSPTTIKGLRRSAKRKSNEIHDCSPVKVNITSFRVPELSINLPETATVANLKIAVMEAAVNLLGGGLHVRVLHHGKKVHDENSTLIQMGIACKDRLDSLAFMLEPSGVSNTSMSIEESVFGYPKGKSPHATCYPVFTSGDDLDGNRQKGVNGTKSGDAETDASNNTEGEEKKDLMSNVGECLKLQKGGVPCKPPTPATAALIVHPHAEGELPAELVMAGQQSFVSFSGKRRTRRPFTVLEVEALVQAVELIGTGRWREVKQQVFSHARHRTYVDLKDKWKTLVHTARIAPHQRRGEPVPQELLDRVLQAHTYWAVQLAKQQEDMGI